MIYLVNTRQFIAYQQIKTEFATNYIILIIIHWKISINLMINSKKLFTSYVCCIFHSALVALRPIITKYKCFKRQFLIDIFNFKIAMNLTKTLFEAYKEEWVNPKYNWDAWIIAWHTILASVVSGVNLLFIDVLLLVSYVAILLEGHPVYRYWIDLVINF